MLEINFRRYKSVAILDLAGSIDIDSANLVEMAGWCMSNGYKDILCVLENVNLVDYAGLSVLAITYKDVLNHKSRIKLLHVPAHIRKVFCVSGLDRVFEMHEDEDFALKSFEEDRIISEIQKKQLRRRFKRLPMDVEFEYRLKNSSEPFHKGKVLNISAVGMLVFTPKIFPLGEILQIKLSLLPKPGELSLDAKIVWLVQKEIQQQIYPGMGLEFYNMEGPVQKKIIDFVDRNLPLGCSTDS